MYSGFQIIIEDEYLEVVDNMFVDQEILGLAVAHMIESLQIVNPKKEFQVKIKWRHQTRRPATMIDEGTVEDLPPSPLTKITNTLGTVVALEKKNNQKRALVPAKEGLAQ
jgi:hypothetical protein